MITTTSERAQRSMPEEALASAVLEQWMHDLRSANPHVRAEAEKSLAERTMLAFWTDCLGLDARVVTDRIQQTRDQPQPLRRRAHGQAGRR